jgi:DNA-binding transcriptional regulator YhcF (GntR family)
MAKKYEQIRAVLLRRLADGTYRVGMRLPTEAEMAASFSVNRHTLRKALDGLVAVGYIDRAPRRGCVVTAIGDDAAAAPQRARLRCFASSAERHSLEASLSAAMSAYRAANPELALELATAPHVGPILTPHAPERHGAETPTVCRLAYVADYAVADDLVPLEQFPDFAEAVAPLEGRLVYRTRDSRTRVTSMRYRRGRGRG